MLTEYTRSPSSTEFLRSSAKSDQAVIVMAFALRALICRTTEDTLLRIDRFILGNVYFTESDIPSGLLEVSTIMAFTDHKSNTNRLDNKLKMTANEYKKMKIIQTTHSEEQIQSEDDLEMEDNDIFNLPSDDEEDLHRV